MSVIVYNILDLVANQGEDNVLSLVSGFSTKSQRDGEEKTLNPDIEHFLKVNAIQFAKEKKSITYLVCDEDDGSILGYFTIAHKAIEVPPAGLSKSSRKKIDRFAQYDEQLDAYIVSAFLIAQFGKNYQVDNGKRITGDELMSLATDELCEIQHRVGGGIKYLDCEADAKLIRFYQDKQNFHLFGERISQKDGKRYLQFLKFF